jgi:hypothetical protein
MTFEKRLICADCMNGFLYSVEEGQARHVRGATKFPTRCPACSASREALQAARAAAPATPSRRRH